MKKALSFFCTLAILLVTLSFGGIGIASAADPQESGVYYQVVNGEATITEYIRAFKPTAVPSTLGGYPVTAIGNAAYYGCTTLTNITIPSSVRSIGQNAFGSCTNLVEVTVKSGVTAIADGAFYQCTKLATISLPDSVTSIGNQSFDNTAYYNDIGNWTGNLLYISNHLVDAKSWTSGDQTVRAGTKSIADASFYGCTGLTSVSLPDGLTAIGHQAFQNCGSLTSVTLPNSVTTLGASAFASCDDLAEFHLSDQLTTIGEQALSGCASLAYLALPSSVTSIGSQAFAGCSALSFLTVDAHNPVYHSDGNCLIETATKTLIAGCQNSHIPADGSVTAIGAYAFYGQSSITAMAIPDGITHIYGYAFMNCRALEQLSVASSVQFFGTASFDNCDVLADIYFGGSSAQWDPLVRAINTSKPLTVARVHFHTLVPHWVLHEVLEPPSCTGSGLGEYICNCGHFINQVLSPTGHPRYEPIETIAPTCTAAGYTIYQCIACTATYHGDIVEAAHTFENDACIWCGLAIAQCVSSNHPYTNADDQAWIVRQTGVVELRLTFSESSYMADGVTLSISDGDHRPVGTYIGNELAGATVAVAGDTAIIHMSLLADATSSAFSVVQLHVTEPALGDVNRDAAIDMKDAFILYHATSGGTPLNDSQRMIADMNGDNQCDMRDTFAVYRIASGG